jgi:hypothetical protein
MAAAGGFVSAGAFRYAFASPVMHKGVIMFLPALLAATVLMADAVPAATPATTVSPATVSAKAKTEPANKPRVICKTESVTGSLMPKKTCYTSDDLAQRRQEERANLEKIQNQLGLQSR